MADRDGHNTGMTLLTLLMALTVNYLTLCRYRQHFQPSTAGMSYVYEQSRKSYVNVKFSIKNLYYWRITLQTINKLFQPNFLLFFFQLVDRVIESIWILVLVSSLIALMTSKCQLKWNEEERNQTERYLSHIWGVRFLQDDKETGYLLSSVNQYFASLGPSCLWHLLHFKKVIKSK